MTKQEKIEQAWFETGITPPEQEMTPDGWVNINGNESVFQGRDKSKFDIRFFSYIRPKSLRGIEGNNGWIKIHCEQDLPKKNGIYLVFRRNWDDICWKEVYFDLNAHDWLIYYTHYRPIEKPEPPLY